MKNSESIKAKVKNYRLLNMTACRERHKKWIQRNPDYYRSQSLRTLYGLSLDSYERMFKEQNGGCKICGKQNLDGKRLFVDHDHTTGTVRGLLCKKCNSGIAYFYEDLSLLESATNYLKFFNERQITDTQR